MATYKKLPSGKWQAQAAIHGVRKSKAFATKKNAQAWAFRFEELIRTGAVEESKTLAEALWNKIRNKAGLGPVLDSDGNVVKEGLRFHDGRATFCTNAAQKISVLDLARITGH